MTCGISPEELLPFCPVRFNDRQSIYWFFKNNQVSFETQRTEKFSGVFQVLFVDSHYFLNLIVLKREWWKNWTVLIKFEYLLYYINRDFKHFLKYVLGMHHHIAVACLKLLFVDQAALKHAENYLPLPFEQYLACFVLLLTWLFSTRHQ